MALLGTAGRKFMLILVELGFILVVGILAHFLKNMPADTMIWTSLSATGLYFGVNFAQKRTEIINAQKVNGNGD